MCSQIHYLDPDDVPACGCTKPHTGRTFASGRVTCPDCQRVLEARRGARWRDEVTAGIDLKRSRGAPK